MPWRVSGRTCSTTWMGCTCSRCSMPRQATLCRTSWAGAKWRSEMLTQVMIVKFCGPCCSLHALICRVKACCHKAVHDWQPGISKVDFGIRDMAQRGTQAPLCMHSGRVLWSEEQLLTPSVTLGARSCAEASIVFLLTHLQRRVWSGACEARPPLRLAAR